MLIVAVKKIGLREITSGSVVGIINLTTWFFFSVIDLNARKLLLYDSAYSFLFAPRSILCDFKNIILKGVARYLTSAAVVLPFASELCYKVSKPPFTEAITDDGGLSFVDILVDGRFIEEEKRLGLRFRGSLNQRIIDMNKTRKNNAVTLWDGIDKKQ